MSNNTLAAALYKPTTVEAHLDSIHHASPLTAVAMIKTLASNKDGIPPEQVREILDKAQVREVRTNPQRRSVIQALNQALKKYPSPAKIVTKAEFAEILDNSINIPAKPDPAWDNARLYYRAVRTTGRQFIVAQICLGWELFNKKKELGFTHGGDRKSSGHAVHLIGKTWEQWIRQEIDPDLQRRTADRLIQTFLGFCEKCPKKLRVTFESSGKRSLITTLSKPPTSLTAKDRQIIETAIAKCSDGETQRSLLEELNLVKVHKALAGGDTSGSKKDKLTDAELMGQLAFKFFQPIAEGLHRMRANPDHEAYLHTIPITSSEEGEISLTMLENDLEAALHDVKAAKKARMKPATVKVIS
jgi:hypothetical protein